MADVVLCQSISADGSTSKRLVIMDEVDGMGGSDRGGIPELIKVLTVSLYMSFTVCLSTHPQTEVALYLFVSYFLSHYYPPAHSLLPTSTLPVSISPSR